MYPILDLNQNIGSISSYNWNILNCASKQNTESVKEEAKRLANASVNRIIEAKKSK